MAEENTSEIKEIENAFDKNPPAMSEESSVETLLVKDVQNVEDVKSVVSKDQEEVKNEVPKPQNGNLRRHSTGTIGGKPQVQSRYRGNHRVASTHDLCKHGNLHGKQCDQDDVVKPWKKNVVRRKSVETSEETSGLINKSLGSRNKQSPVTKPESSVSAKRDVLAVKKKPCPSSVTSETSSVKEDGSEIAKSPEGSSNDKARKKKETANTLSVKKVPPSLRNEKPKSDMEKVSKISDNGESSKVVSPKKNKEKAKIQETSGEDVKDKTQEIISEDVKEKTVCVVESSVKGVRSEKKKTIRSAQKSPTKKIPGSLNMKKESGSLELEANPKPEMKIRSKKTGVKVTLAKPELSFKRGKVLTPKAEDSSSPTWLKFRKRVTLEKKPETEGKKKNLKRLVVETKPDTCESSKREKVMLRHRKVEGKKKMITSFNNVIEETMIKLTKLRKSKVKALVGAFETVISLQETKTSQKIQNKASTSASKVSPQQ